jgi:hypothetical protein
VLTASRRTYTCFVCQKAGHEVQVYLDGKDEQGRTKYLNEYGTKHTHLGSNSSQSQSQSQPQKNESTTVVSESTQSESTQPQLQLKLIAARLEYAISLLERLQQQSQ